MKIDITEEKSVWKEVKAEWKGKDKDNVVIKSKHFNVPKLEKEVADLKDKKDEIDNTVIEDLPVEVQKMMPMFKEHINYEYSIQRRWLNRINKIKDGN